MVSESKVSIEEWFDVKNVEHVLAYRYLGKHGHWPENFIPKHVICLGPWQVSLMAKMSEAWVAVMIGGKG